MDDDSVGEGLVVGLNVKSSLLSVQCVLLDEVDVVHTCNLRMHAHTHTCHITETSTTSLSIIQQLAFHLILLSDCVLTLNTDPHSLKDT